MSSKKEIIAFGNLYAIFESNPGMISNKLSDKVKIRDSELKELNDKRDTIIINSENNSSFFNLSGVFKNIPYELKGWIGIHASISKDIAELNDKKFIRNMVYNPNRLRLYVRNKLAVENFLDILKNSQAFANYIEGEISFDILDDDRLPDIATTSRENISDSDGRVTLLTNLLKPIVSRLIVERVNIGTVLRNEELNILENQRRIEERKKEEERLAKEKAILEQERERVARQEAEAAATKLGEENAKLENEKTSLDLQNKMKDVLLSEQDTRREKLLVHELSVVSNVIDTATNDMVSDFQKSDDFSRISKYIYNFKYSTTKLDIIKNQFLRLNDYDIEGGAVINIKGYLSSYFDNVPLNRRRIKNNIGPKPFEANVDVFELGVLVDNILQNAIDRDANYIRVEFDDSLKQMSFISDTGPILVEPIDEIFKLGVTSRDDGTGVGLFLVHQIATKFNWRVYAESRGKEAVIVIDFGNIK